MNTPCQAVPKHSFLRTPDNAENGGTQSLRYKANPPGTSSTGLIESRSGADKYSARREIAFLPNSADAGLSPSGNNMERGFAQRRQ